MLPALVLAATLAAAPPTRFAWPLKDYDGLAASFGEYRGDRLHTGIDLKTRGETGWPVLAAADGFVFRLKDEWRGYGHALYLKHADGYVTLYGHLERYEEQHLHLQTLLRRARHGKRHAGDIYLDRPVQVRRGDVIAYSGESGFGLPHLHFEVRQGEDTAVDPLRNGLAPRSDETLSLVRLHVLPAGATSRIDGRRAPATVDLATPGASPQAGPTVSGPLRLALEAVANAGATNPIGLRLLEARLDERPILALDLAAIPFARSFRAGAVFDLGLTRFGPTSYVYRLDGFGSGELAGLSGASPPLSLAPGVHTLAIRAQGPLGAIKEARVKLSAVDESPPPPAAPSASATAAPTVDGVEAWPEGLVLRFAASPSLPPRIALTAPAADLPIHLEPAAPAWCLVQVEASGSLSGAALGDGAIAYVRAAATAPFTLHASALTFAAPAQALYAETLIAAVAEPATRWPPPEGLKLLAGPYSLVPDALPLRQAASVAIAAAAERAGIYGLDPLTGQWGYMDNRESPGGVAARVWRTGVYAALRDDAPPVLSEPSPAAGATLSSREPLRPEVGVKDTGMSLDEDGVTMTLDGRELRASFDPDRGRASADEVARLKPGRHRLELSARDRAGNAATPLIVSFTAR